MNMHPLRQDDDDVQRLLTRVFHETGYRVDRRDPVIVPFIVQKAMLCDFKKEEENLFTQFTEGTISTIKAEIEKLEKQSGRLMELSRTTAAETVAMAGGEFNQHILNTMRKADNAVFDNLNKLTTKFLGEQNTFMEKMEKAHQDFVDTANRFNNIVLRLFLGIIAFAGVIGFVMGCWQRIL